MSFAFAAPVRAVVITGASGFVVSVASFGAEASDVLPAASVAVAVTFPAGIFPAATSIVATPSVAVALPISVPVLSYSLTVEPVSACTLTVTLSFAFAAPVRFVVMAGASGFLITFPSNLATGAGASDATPAPLCL